MSAVTGPRRTMTYLPLGKQLCYFLADPRLREAMRYRIDETRRAPAGEYWDVFDGEEYKSKRHLFDGKSSMEIQYACTDTYSLEGPDDIAIALYADEFHLTNKGRPWKMTLLHVVILNLPPEQRYETQNTIQLFVTPGPKSLANIWSFLAPVLEELKYLQETGLTVITLSE